MKLRYFTLIVSLAIKRIRSSETKKLRNKYQHKSTRTVIKKLEQETKKAAAVWQM